MHTHHSHSGQYVQHAHDDLDSIIEAAINKKFETFCLTEHMPRYHSKDLYPEEIASETTSESLKATFDAYYSHAQLIKSRINSDSSIKTQILVGFEAEGIDQFYLSKGVELLKEKSFDLIVGSVHHVHNIPIDYDIKAYNEAKALSSPSTDIQLFEDYFDLQYQMLTTLKPTVVGHFDLIRLFSPLKVTPVDPKAEPKLWAKIIRNIEYAVSIDALFELNSAAIRKGWSTPYPAADIAKAILQKGGKFCLSDDSHGIDQVGLNLHKALEYLESIGGEFLYHLALEDGKTVIKKQAIEEVKQNEFWLEYK